MNKYLQNNSNETLKFRKTGPCRFYLTRRNKIDEAQNLIFGYMGPTDPNFQKIKIMIIVISHVDIFVF